MVPEKHERTKKFQIKKKNSSDHVSVDIQSIKNFQPTYN